jgi:hypothetical protein
MSQGNRILNTTSGKMLKRNQALKAIDACACAWVIEGQTMRNLTLAESIAARNEQASMRDPLPHAELPGISYQPTAAGLTAARNGYELIMRANAFCGLAG